MKICLIKNLIHEHSAPRACRDKENQHRNLIAEMIRCETKK